MNWPNLLSLLLISALWGASFLFMRVAAPEFGPIPLIVVRVGGAAVCLLPFLGSEGRRELVSGPRGRWFWLGTLNAALPYSLFAFAALSLEAGYMSLLNATTVLCTAIIGMAWWRQRLHVGQLVGIAIGFVGLTVLVWDRLSFKPGGTGWAIAAVLVATACYGVAVNYAKHRLSRIPSSVLTAGMMAGATLVLFPLAWWQWPSHPISEKAWAAAGSQAVLSTALPLWLHLQLLRRVSPTAASAVTFLIPIFGIVLGVVFLQEALTMRMILGMLVTFIGTALTIELWPRAIQFLPSAVPKSEQ